MTEETTLSFFNQVELNDTLVASEIQNDTQVKYFTWSDYYSQYILHYVPKTSH